MRADGIGDALACAPLVAGLRDAGHVLGAVLGTANRNVFAQRTFSHTHVLERIPWPRHGSTPASHATALAGVRAARYDAALVATEEPEAYAFAARAGIGVRIGFTNGWEKPLKTLATMRLLTHALVRPASARRAREHEAIALFRLGAGFVRASEPTRDAARLRELVLDRTPARQRVVALQASPKLAAEGLDRAAYVALARALAGRGRAVRIYGDDVAFVRAVASAAGVPGFAPLDVAAWKAHLAAAEAIVTPDSGAAHVAGMLGIPCVDAFPPSPSTAHDIVRWRPWAAPYRAVVLDRAREPAATAAVLLSALDDLFAVARRT